MKNSKTKTLETLILHLGENEHRVDGSIVQPIFQSSTYLMPQEDLDYDSIRYVRLNNTPNHELLHQKLAAIEKGEAGLVTSSGMSAITSVLLGSLQASDHLLALNCLYGGTAHFLAANSERLGWQYSLVSGDDEGEWKKHLKPTTRAFYVETITNPLLEVPDLQNIVKFCRAHGLLSVIDNTFASPVNFNPIAMGFDVVVHSATKYLNGHSDLAAGAIVTSKERMKNLTHHFNHLGGTLDPHACVLLSRGLKTLGLRVERQNSNALELARFLENHPQVERVVYPGLESHPQHARAKEWFKGFGGMLGFEVKGGVEAAEKLTRNLQYFFCAPSLGGVESLITRPTTTSHVG